VIDRRFNGGGQIADYVIEQLQRKQTELLLHLTRAGGAFHPLSADVVISYPRSVRWAKRTWEGLVEKCFGRTASYGWRLSDPLPIWLSQPERRWDVEEPAALPDC